MKPDVVENRVAKWRLLLLSLNFHNNFLYSLRFFFFIFIFVSKNNDWPRQYREAFILSEQVDKKSNTRQYISRINTPTYDVLPAHRVSHIASASFYLLAVVLLPHPPGQNQFPFALHSKFTNKKSATRASLFFISFLFWPNFYWKVKLTLDKKKIIWNRIENRTTKWMGYC